MFSIFSHTIPRLASIEGLPPSWDRLVKRGLNWRVAQLDRKYLHILLGILGLAFFLTTKTPPFSLCQYSESLWSYHHIYSFFTFLSVSYHPSLSLGRLVGDPILSLLVSAFKIAYRVSLVLVTTSVFFSKHLHGKDVSSRIGAPCGRGSGQWYLILIKVGLRTMGFGWVSALGNLKGLKGDSYGGPEVTSNHWHDR